MVAEVQKWVMSVFNDPIVKKLQENSHLSKTQLETIIIDFLSEEIVGKHIIYDVKAKIRKKRPSRGSFNRSLTQAKRNMSKSINTILLLGYIGILDNPKLQPYIELSNKLNAYVQTIKKEKDYLNNQRERNLVQDFTLMKKELLNLFNDTSF